MYEKESLNSGGQQFQQYRQNEQSPLILTELTEHKKDDDLQCWKSRSSSGQAQNGGRIKPVNGITTIPSW